MKINKLLMAIAVSALGMTALADTQTNGEWAYMLDGTPAMVGQSTNDHLFVRGTYQDETRDNRVTFDQGATKLVWFWLDDDEIYLNERVQALTPIAYNDAGDLYQEITYNSFQCDLYLPENVALVGIVNDAGEDEPYAQGDRLPTSSQFMYQQENNVKVIDGVTYRIYHLLCTSTKDYGSHFSARNAARYKANGALKKDDAPLLGLYLHNEAADVTVGEMPDMIIANLEFGFREAFNAKPAWGPNDYRFVYGTGGNNESQRYQFYQRVKLFDTDHFEVTEMPTISYKKTATSVIISATGQGEVVLMVNDKQVENPYTVERGDNDLTVIATATAREQGKGVSDVARMTIDVPARSMNQGDNMLVMPDNVLAEPGKPFDLHVAMANSDEITAMQCDVYLPDGVTLAQDGLELIGDRASSSHSATMKLQADGAMRILITSPVAEPFGGCEGDLFVLHLNAAGDLADGSYTMTLANIVLADVDAVTYAAPDQDAVLIVKSYARGDANGDGSVNVGDYVATANYILGLNPDPFVFSAADVDENETINVGDLVGIINIMMGDFSMPSQTPQQGTNVKMNGDYDEENNSNDNETSITLNLENEIPLTAWQMELAMPKGVTLAEASLTARAAHHNLSVHDLGEGRYRLLGFSAVNGEVAGSKGALLTLRLLSEIPNDIPYLEFSNILLAEPDMTMHKVDAFAVGFQTISVDEVQAGARIYASGNDVVVDTPVETTVDLITPSGMIRTVKAHPGVNTYSTGRGICIVRAAGQVAKLKF